MAIRTGVPSGPDVRRASTSRVGIRSSRPLLEVATQGHEHLFGPVHSFVHLSSQALEIVIAKPAFGGTGSARFTDYSVDLGPCEWIVSPLANISMNFSIRLARVSIFFALSSL